MTKTPLTSVASRTDLPLSPEGKACLPVGRGGVRGHFLGATQRGQYEENRREDNA